MNVVLSDVFRDELDQIRAENPTVTIEALIAKDLRADCDPALVALIFRNLIGNAVKYRRDEAKATLEFGFNGEAYYVRDQGLGFDPGDAERIFRPFERLHQKAEVSGTGIGLANVQRVVERHGGRVWAEGIRGQGATIFFTLRT